MLILILGCLLYINCADDWTLVIDAGSTGNTMEIYNAGDLTAAKIKCGDKDATNKLAEYIKGAIT